MSGRAVCHMLLRVCLMAVLGSVLPAHRVVAQDGPVEPVNLASTARVSASNEYNGDFLASFAVDSQVPAELCGDDRLAAWVVRGVEQNFQGSFSFEWDKPVEVEEVLYCGRTAMILEECFKDYEVYLDDAKTPIAKGSLEMRHGPQRIDLPRSTITRLTLKFLSAYTSRYNPGASEIGVFRARVSDQFLADFGVPPAERTPAARRLAEDLYAGSLGFRDILVIQRHHLSISHVYTYHVEGYRPGGGLFVFTPTPDGGELRKLVDAGDGEIIDCDLSYDATQVVFSWKRGGLQMAQPNQLLRRRRPQRPREQLPGLPREHRRDRTDATDRRAQQQSERLLAARRRHRLHFRPQAGLRLLFRHDLAGALPDGSRRATSEAALGELPDGLHPFGTQRRADHLHALGIRGPAGVPDPEPVDDQPRRHWTGRLLRQSGDRAGHVHGRSADPRHAQDHLPGDEPQR